MYITQEIVNMNLQENIRRILREEEDRYDDKVGKTFWFEYHCYESPESCDAEIWYRSHQKVKVIGVSEWSYDDKEWRQEDGNPRVYLVQWEDGFQYDVFEDELMESPNEFYRPSPPKRKIQENIRRILREEYDEAGKRKSFEQPIKFFYTKYLKENPIEYKGIYLHPTYHENQDVLTWEIENPEDYSFNGEILKEKIVGEFKDFCVLVNLDFYGTQRRVYLIENMPNGWYYLNEKDRNFIETVLSNKKYLEFNADDSQFMLNFTYKRLSIQINSDIIELNTAGYFNGVKIDEDGKEHILDHNFLQKMSDNEYDEMREDFLFNGFYNEVINYLSQNPRFYEHMVDMWDLHIQPLKEK